MTTIHANLVFQACILVFEVFEEKQFKQMLAIRHLVLQACTSFLRLSDKSGASLFLPCSQKMPLLTRTRPILGHIVSKEASEKQKHKNLLKYLFD